MLKISEGTPLQNLEIGPLFLDLPWVGEVRRCSESRDRNRNRNHSEIRGVLKDDGPSVDMNPDAIFFLDTKGPSPIWNFST